MLWQKFGEFEPGTHFGAWACRVAYFQVLSHLKRRRSDRLVFDEHFIEAIDAHARRMPDNNELYRQRHRAMLRCLETLDPQQRRVLQERYAAGATAVSVARSLGTSPNAVRKTISRLHRSLLRCIEQRLSRESRA